MTDSWWLYERRLVARATNDSYWLLKLDSVGRLIFLTVVALATAAVSVALRGGAIDAGTLVSGAVPYLAYAVVWLVYWIPAPLFVYRELQTDAQAKVDDLGAEITELKSRLHAKAVAQETLESQKDAARKALETFRVLLVDSDALLVRAHGVKGNQLSFDAWDADYKKWRVDVVRALNEFAAAEIFGFERLHLRQIGHVHFNPGISRQWSRGLDQFEAERSHLSGVVAGAEGRALALGLAA